MLEQSVVRVARIRPPIISSDVDEKLGPSIKGLNGTLKPLVLIRNQEKKGFDYIILSGNDIYFACKSAKIRTINAFVFDRESEHLKYQLDSMEATEDTDIREELGNVISELTRQFKDIRTQITLFRTSVQKPSDEEPNVKATMDMKAPALRELCKIRGITGYSNMRKADMVRRLNDGPYTATSNIEIAVKLNSMTSNEEGMKFLKEYCKHKTDLQMLAQHLDIPFGKRDLIPQLTEKIIESTIAYRTRAAAIIGSKLS